ncbi:MAG TPA: hypothetical protein VLX92_04435, partial [Kofleriaceae bacterium]|nr:hypothetical protein [Kofleriaceae bacterium]
MLGIALRDALGATLGIPRGSVRAQTVGVGADRLARPLAARRQRLAIRSEPRRARRRGGVCRRAVVVRGGRASGLGALIVARSARTARWAAIAARPAAIVAAVALASRTPALGTAAATGAAIAEVARRRGELPADAGARHLPAPGPVVVLALFLGRTDLEAAQATRLVAIAAPAEAAAAAATTAALAAAVVAIAAAPG